MKKHLYIISFHLLLQTRNDEFTLKPKPTEVVDFKRGKEQVKYAVYNVPDFVQGRSVLNVEGQYQGSRTYSPIVPPVLHAHRFLTGSHMKR